MNNMQLVLVPPADESDPAFEGKPDVLLNVRLSAEQWDMLLFNCSQMNCSPGEFFRHAIAELP
jgi:hypothetical protein